MLLPSDAIQVLENTPSKVVVWDPPAYSFGTYLFLLAAAFLIPGAFLIFRRTGVPFAWILVATAVCVAALASFLITSQRVITLSRSDGMLSVKKSRWGIAEYQSLPLNQIRRVTVENIRYSHSLVLITKSGESFSLGNGSGREGYYGASEAMNSFLGVGAP